MRACRRPCREPTLAPADDFAVVARLSRVISFMTGQNTPVTVLGTGSVGTAVAEALLSAGPAATVWNRGRCQRARDDGYLCDEHP